MTQTSNVDHPLKNENSTSNDNGFELNPSLKKKSWIAFLLSLLMVGLGHVYAGKTRKGVYLYLGFVLLAISFKFVCFSFAVFVTLSIIVALVYLYSAYDAYHIIQKNPFIVSKRIDKLSFCILILAVEIIVFSVIPKNILEKVSLVNYYRLPSSVMSPTIEPEEYFVSKRTKNIDIGDIVTLKGPENEILVFRCMGLPGDTIEIKDNQTFISGVLVDDKNSIKSLYRINTNGERLSPWLLSKYNISDFMVDMNGDYLIELTEPVANEIANIRVVKQLVKIYRGYSDMLYPKTANFGWTANNYGPVYIPKKGERIKLTFKNIELYRAVILNENVDNCKITPTSVIIDGNRISYYIFKSDYVFVLGDNRDNALDSRFLGFIDIEDVQGKVSYIIWSRQKNRIGKSL